MIAAIPNVVGMGVPSKYFDFPLLSLGRTATVTLNLARRVRPQRTKIVRRTWSTGVRMPSAKAQAAGARPKEIYITRLLGFRFIFLA
jgi:hypothetical protein